MRTLAFAAVVLLYATGAVAAPQTGAYEFVSNRGGSVDLHKDWQWISGSSAGCFLDLPIWTAMQGGRSPTGVTVHIGGQIHAATLTGRLSKYV